MKIGIGLNVLGWHLGEINIRVDLDQPTQTDGSIHLNSIASPAKFMDSMSDYFSSRYLRRHNLT